jgi:hypothetical protein
MNLRYNLFRLIQLIIELRSSWDQRVHPSKRAHEKLKMQVGNHFLALSTNYQIENASNIIFQYFLREKVRLFGIPYFCKIC